MLTINYPISLVSRPVLVNVSDLLIIFFFGKSVSMVMTKTGLVTAAHELMPIKS